MAQIIKRDGLTTHPGDPYLLGATLHHDGCNFAIFSKNATQVTLFLFNEVSDTTPAHRIILDKRLNKTGDVWHIFLYGIGNGQVYGYMVDGPFDPVHSGHRFNSSKLLLDPYAKAVGGSYSWNDSTVLGYESGHTDGDLSLSTSSNHAAVVKSMVVDCTDFDWELDKPLDLPMKDTIIYEMHVRAFTNHPSSGVAYNGTFKGIIDKIPYLKDLGVTSIELLPVQEFNEDENINHNPVTGERLKNFWGYSTLAFFAPEIWYASDHDGITAVREFKEMVKALHNAGIEVIMDVVYNHTGEGNEWGPTLSFRGLDNSIYYMLENCRYYKNYSGCGNTLNCNHPVVKKLIKDSLRYWVIDMHVDGFRFDLASILGRDQSGNWVPDYSVLSEISHDPILSNTKIIAESWDAAGLYKVGGFPDGWAEWNGKFRDHVRGFLKGDNGLVREMGKRLTGSSDLFFYGSRKPFHSINFITAHDGFTLYDLVSYNSKHNEANCEDNRDGDNHNLSWNCGVEGLTGDQEILELRRRQVKNFIALLMVSQGTPMLLSGDEFGFSKQGNNNTYCHDNELNWLDWSLLDKNREIFEFCRYMIWFRRNHPVLRRETFLTGQDTAGNDMADISWHGVQVSRPDWSDQSHSIAFMLDGSKYETGADRHDNDIYVAINAFWEELWFELPPAAAGKKWYLAVNTHKHKSIYDSGKEPLVDGSHICVGPRSTVICIDK
jgi:isoamylase